MKPVNFGIDLGTTNSLIAKYDNGSVTIFKNPIGHKETLASVVVFRKDKTLIGDKAREYISKDPLNVFGGFKRKMGTDDKYYVVNRDENITPIELSSLVLKELKNFIHNGENPEATVITIPASFDSMQSNATQKAGQEAGFQTVFLLQEPIAASLAYFNHSTQEDNSGYWLVYDLGGGTFDAALVSIKEGDMSVTDHEGNNFLGGVDFDTAIVEKIIAPYIGNQIENEDFLTQLTEPNSPLEKLYYILLHKAEEAKKDLSSYEETEVECSFEYNGEEIESIIPITRNQFNELIAPNIEATIKMIRQILDRNHLDIAQINQLILVGGSTYIPFVRESLSSQLNIKVNTDVDPTTAVAEGAAFYAANKSYQPSNNTAQELSTTTIDDLLVNMEEEEKSNVEIILSYTKTSREDEEILLAKVVGEYDHFYYRIIRKDGGFDSGIAPLKSKFTAFVPLIKNLNNQFSFIVLDENYNELKSLKQEFAITQGQYNIQGQPIPKDVCIEVDDAENKTTKLEPIFEKNSLLPQKKTLYREVSRTIQKGSSESIVINILEGDRFAKPVSNLPIGQIEITGKDLNADLLKGSDIEVNLMMDESRQLHCSVYLVMTDQEFKNVFSISEKHINISRLKEQFFDLEKDIRESIKSFQYQANEVLSIQATELRKELGNIKNDIVRIRENDKSDKKYILADTIQKVASEFDKLGGNERLESLRNEYLEAKDFFEEQIVQVDFEKEKLKERFHNLVRNEDQLLKSRNASVLTNATRKMNELGWDALYNTTSFLIGKYSQLKGYPEDYYTNYSGAKKIFKLADEAMDKEQYFAFRQHVYNLTHLIKMDKSMDSSLENFKGTGLG